MLKTMQANRTTLTITSAAVLIAAGAWFWTSRPAITATVPPPAPQQIAKVEKPQQELAAIAPQQAEDSSAMRDALLGLNKPKQEEERVAPKRARRARPQIIEDVSAPAVEEEFPTELSDRAFQSAIGNWRGVKSCLVAQQAQNKEVEGSIRVSFVISGSGDVLEAKAFDESNASVKEISECVERQAKMVKFRPFSGEDVAKEAKFVF